MNKKYWIGSLAICLFLATLSPLASSSPDGLERVAEDVGFIDNAASSSLSVIEDYLFPGINNPNMAAILAGWIGTLLLFAIAYGVTWAIFKMSKNRLH